MMQLPHYRTEPGIVGSLTDLIVRERDYIMPRGGRIQFISCYQGETDYHALRGPDWSQTHGERRLTFRYAKVPWRWGFLKEGERYWNYATEAEFQKQVNGAWGILHQGSEAVDPETLAVFREECYELAVTGFYNHLAGGWELCEPTTERRSHDTWIRTPRALEVARELNMTAFIQECLAAQAAHPLAA